MASTQMMLQAHPQRATIDQTVMNQCLEALYECANVCTLCADACLAEQDVQMLARCIRLNLDCSDICATTGKLLSRQRAPDWAIIRAQVQACIAICRACGQECRQHSDHGMEHCRLCADACQRCLEACERLLQALPSNGHS